MTHANIETTLGTYTHTTEKMAEQSVEIFEKVALCQMLWSIPDRNIFCPVFHEQNPIESRCFRWFLRSGLFNKNIIRRLKFTKLLKL